MNSEIQSVDVFQPTTLAEAMKFAEMLSQSGMVPKDYIGKPGAIIAAWEMGRPFGLSAMQSCQGIAVINGRPSMWGDLFLGVIQSCEGYVNIDEDAPDVALKNGCGRCKLSRRVNGEVVTIERRFSMVDAKTANLWGKAGPWSQYPGRMFQMRARGWAGRDLFSDRLKGLALAEEAQDIAINAEGSSRVVNDMMPKPEAPTVADSAPAAPSSAPVAEAPKPSAPAHDGEVMVKVLDVKESNGTNTKTGKAWTKYGVVVDNGGSQDTLGTFSETIGNDARALIGRDAFVLVEESVSGGKTYFNLMAIRVATFDAPASSDDIPF